MSHDERKQRTLKHIEDDCNKEDEPRLNLDVQKELKSLDITLEEQKELAYIRNINGNGSYEELNFLIEKTLARLNASTRVVDKGTGNLLLPKDVAQTFSEAKKILSPHDLTLSVVNETFDHKSNNDFVNKKREQALRLTLHYRRESYSGLLGHSIEKYHFHLPFTEITKKDFILSLLTLFTIHRHKHRNTLDDVKKFLLNNLKEIS